MSAKGFTEDPPPGVDMAYVENHGAICPFCKTGEKIRDSGSMEELAAHIECDNCGYDWLECYDIIGILVRPDDLKELE